MAAGAGCAEKTMCMLPGRHTRQRVEGHTFRRVSVCVCVCVRVCPKPGCDVRNTLQHLLMSANRGPMPTGTNALLEYLVVLARAVSPANPGILTPLTHQEISLIAPPNEAEVESISTDTEGKLPFEEDP